MISSLCKFMLMIFYLVLLTNLCLRNLKSYVYRIWDENDKKDDLFPRNINQARYRWYIYKSNQIYQWAMQEIWFEFWKFKSYTDEHDYQTRQWWNERWLTLRNIKVWLAIRNSWFEFNPNIDKVLQERDNDKEENEKEASSPTT